MTRKQYRRLTPDERHYLIEHYADDPQVINAIAFHLKIEPPKVLEHAVKQLGTSWAKSSGTYRDHSKGGAPQVWPQDLQIREFPSGARSRCPGLRSLFNAVIANTKEK